MMRMLTAPVESRFLPTLSKKRTVFVHSERPDSGSAGAIGDNLLAIFFAEGVVIGREVETDVVLLVSFGRRGALCTGFGRSH